MSIRSLRLRAARRSAPLLAAALALPALGAPGPVAAAPAPVSASSATLPAGSSAGSSAGLPAGSSAGSARALPALRVSRLATGLQIPWDVQPIGTARFLVTERETARLYRISAGSRQRVDFPSGTVWRSGETGLMSLEVDPYFGENRRFYTCQGGFTAGGDEDVRVNRWVLSADGRRATFERTMLAGLPASSGRHGGCRLLVLTSGLLMVGTGDAAVGTTPQNLRSLGGKTLLMQRANGAPAEDNPFVDAANRNRRYVWTYGHRNIQGLAQRADGSLWSVEHGSSRDDEVNRLFKGGNYGWNPVPGYNESVPMTDFSLPGRQFAARWRSGRPTVATSGAAWVRGARWGDYDGTLAVAALKASRLIFMRFDGDGRLRWTRAPEALQRFGRLRSVTNAPNGDLLVTTSNGSNDAVLRVAPR